MRDGRRIEGREEAKGMKSGDEGWKRKKERGKDIRREEELVRKNKESDRTVGKGKRTGKERKGEGKGREEIEGEKGERRR